MTMEITGSYGNYGANYVDTTKKAGGNAAAQVKPDTPADGGDKVQQYYEKLCKKFPQINFNINGGILPGNSSRVTVNLSYDCLKKMANDSEFAKEMEWNLLGETAANTMVYGWAKRDGVVLGGRTVIYDANGNRQSSCGGMRTANAGKSDSAKKLSEAEEMAAFKKEFYAELEKIRRDRTIANVAINISEKAFENMKNDPEYREQILSVIRRDMTSSVAPAPDCSLLITVGATAKDYRGDSWSVYNDSEFYARSGDSFYKKTRGQKGRKKELLEEYLEKRAQVKKQRKEVLNEKITKQEQEKSRLTKEWSREKLMSKAAGAYEANVITKTAAGNVSLPG